MEILLGTFYTAIFIGLIFKLPFFKMEHLSRKLISGIFILKIIVGVGLFLLYSYYYTDRKHADIFKYFDDSKVLYDALWSHPSDFFQMLFGINDQTEYFMGNYYSKMEHWNTVFQTNVYNSSRIMIRLNAIIRIFSFGYFNVHTVFINFISLLGLLALYKSFSRFGLNNKLLIGAIFFIPSVLFWGSGVLKEGVLLFAFGFLLLSFFHIAHKKFTWSQFLVFLFSLLLMFYVKIYVLIAIIPALLGYWWVIKTNNKNALLKYGVVYVLGGLVFFNAHLILPQYNILGIISQKQNDSVNMARGGVYLATEKIIIYIPDEDRKYLEKVDSDHFKVALGSSYFYFNSRHQDTVRIENSTDTTVYSVLFNAPHSGSLLTKKYLLPTVKDFFLNIPGALINTIIKPLPLESFSPLMLLSEIENLILFILVIMSFVYRKKISKERVNLVAMCLLYTLVLYLLIGWSTPVLGAIVRYKVPALPLLFVGILLFSDQNKLVKKFTFLQSKP